MKAYFSIIFFALTSYFCHAQEWVQTNGPEGGIIRAFCATGNTYFAATNGVGVMLSTDNGDHWKSSGLNQPYANALALSQGNVVFTGTSGGVYKSSDLGVTWQLVSNLELRAILVKGDTLWGAGGNNGNGFFSSFDKGTTWTAALNKGMATTAISALAFYGNKIFAGTGQGVFVSSDNGNNWVATNNGIASNNLNILSLYFHGNTLFAGGTNDNSLYRSNDFGATWAAVVGGPLNVYAITGNSSFIYASSFCNGIYRSSDNGNSWAQLKTGLINSCIWSLLIDNGHVLAGTYGGGIFVSNDQGNTWTAKNNGLKNAWIIPTAVKDGFIMAGTMGDGIHKSSDNGITWSLLNTYTLGASWTNINAQVNAIAVHNNSIFIGGDAGTGMIRSIDDGQTWKVLNVPVIQPSIAGFASASDTIWANSEDGSILKSSDNGDSWSIAGKIVNEISRFTFNSLVVSGSNIYVGTFDGVFVSRDKGVTWSSSNAGLTNNFIFSLTKIGSVLVAGTGLGVFISTDNGKNWLPTSLSTVSIYSLYVNGSTIYAGASYGGVFQSDDNGATWTQLGKYFGSVYSLCANVDRLFAGTGDTGVWTYLPSCNPPPQPIISITYGHNNETIFQSSSPEENQWFLNGLVIPGATETSYTPTVSGIYSVRAGSGGCNSTMSDGISFHITVPETPDPYVAMPNVFTPNGDKENPSFVPIAYKNIKSGLLRIFNRWGQEVFQTTDPETGWNGEKSEAGEYYFVLTYQGLNGITGKLKGWVQIVR